MVKDLNKLISSADDYVFNHYISQKKVRNWECDHPIVGLVLPVETENCKIEPLKIWRKCFGHGAQGFIVDADGNTTTESVFFGGALLNEAIERFKTIRFANTTIRDAINDTKKRRKIPTGKYIWAGGNTYHLESQVKGLALCGIKTWGKPFDHKGEDHRPVCKTCIKIKDKQK